MKKLSTVVLVMVSFMIILSCVTALGNTTRVVATGDSITGGYSPVFLQQSLDESGFDAEVFNVASGGCNADRYVGNTIDPRTLTFVDYGQEVISLDPDVIIFMLGTNDASQCINNPQSVDPYKALLGGAGGVFDQFQTAVNSRGIRSKVILSTLIPVIEDSDHTIAMNDIIENTFNPWLIEQGIKYGFELVDSHALIQEQANWQDFYSDSVHLWANGAEGYQWMAENFGSTVISAVPEPATILLIGCGAVMLRRKRCFKST